MCQPKGIRCKVVFQILKKHEVLPWFMCILHFCVTRSPFLKHAHCNSIIKWRKSSAPLSVKTNKNVLSTPCRDITSFYECELVFLKGKIGQTLQIANCLVSLYVPTHTYLFRYTSKVEIFFFLRGIDLSSAMISARLVV